MEMRGMLLFTLQENSSYVVLFSNCFAHVPVDLVCGSSVSEGSTLNVLLCAVVE